LDRRTQPSSYEFRQVTENGCVAEGGALQGPEEMLASVFAARELTLFLQGDQNMKLLASAFTVLLVLGMTWADDAQPDEAEKAKILAAKAQIDLLDRAVQ